MDPSPATIEPPDLIPARMLNEVVYCPRLYYLEHVLGEWDDSADTVHGRRVHRRVDAREDALPLSEELSPEDRLHARSVTVSAPEEGIIAKTDLIEVEDGAVVPVDYKRGSAPGDRAPCGVWPADRVQIGAQVLALRASGYRCDRGVIYYAASKTRVPVEATEDLVLAVREAVRDARRIAAAAEMPPPLVASPKCPRCSLVGICLPDETNALREGFQDDAGPEDAPGWVGDLEAAGAPSGLSEGSDAETLDDALASGAEDEVGGQGRAPGPSGSADGQTGRRRVERPRPLITPRDDRLPLYVQAQGARIGRSKDLLEVRTKEGDVSTVRLRQTSHVCVFGAVQLTHAALGELCERGIGVSLFSYGGWHYGEVSGFSGKNVLLRITQFQAARDPAVRLRLARAFIATKILNCRTLVRRNAEAPALGILARLKQLAEQARRADAEESLLGIEGTAARLYFEELGKLVRPGPGGRGAFDFAGRNRRPPRDPVNALLSLGYALLCKDVRIALCAAGFDPMVGFYHKPRHGRPALALDLMEEFRPLIVDSVVLTAVNTDAVQEDHFIRAAAGVALTEAGRRAFIAAYERRMDQEITHPLFGYQVSYRRVLEIQARLLSRVVSGEIPQYPGFRTR